MPLNYKYTMLWNRDLNYCSKNKLNTIFLAFTDQQNYNKLYLERNFWSLNINKKLLLNVKEGLFSCDSICNTSVFHKGEDN